MKIRRHFAYFEESVCGVGHRPVLVYLKALFFCVQRWQDHPRRTGHNVSFVIAVLYDI